jgi:serine protease
VIFDVQGYVSVPSPAPSTSGLYNPIVPHRILDTRPSSIGQHGVWTVTVAGSAGGLVPSTGASAVVLNVTATNPSTSSYLTVWPHGQPQPVVSNLNFVKGQTVPNRVIVPLGANGQVDIYNSAGSVQVVVDVNGWFADGVTQVTGSGYLGTAPVRLLDTRNNGGPLGVRSTRTVPVAGVDGIPQNAKALVANITAANTTGASYLTVWPAGTPQPVISDLNWVAGETVPNLVVVQVGPTGAINLYNSAGSVNVIIDVVGWYSG